MMAHGCILNVNLRGRNACIMIKTNNNLPIDVEVEDCALRPFKDHSNNNTVTSDSLMFGPHQKSVWKLFFYSSSCKDACEVIL